MNRMTMGSIVVALLAAAGCRNAEPPARTPEIPPAPSSSTLPPAGTASTKEFVGARAILASQVTHDRSRETGAAHDRSAFSRNSANSRVGSK